MHEHLLTDSVDAFTDPLSGTLVLTGLDAHDGRGVALQVTKHDAIALIAWLTQAAA